jgi:hypothetical protein
MATTEKFSFAALANYGNSTAQAATNLQSAFVTDAKKFYAKAGYPSKDEISILDEIKPDLTNTVEAIPQFVSGFMHDEKRAFDIPAADNNTCAATIKVVSVDEKTKEGTIMLGDKKGETYTSTVLAHDELVVKNKRGPFKKK